MPNNTSYHFLLEKKPLFQSFFMVAVVILVLFSLFSYKRAEGKVVFSFRYEKEASGDSPKKPHAGGDPRSLGASLFTMIFFLFFSPAISDPDAQRECHFEDQREWEGTLAFP